MVSIEPMNIRNLLPEDLQQLRKISQDAVLESVNAPESEKPTIVEGIFDNLDKAGSSSIPGAFLTAEANQALAGFILIKNYWNLSDLFVSPNLHGKGIGHALWSAALLECERHSEKNSVRVNSSLNAVMFYESLGFRRIDLKIELPSWVVPLERQLSARRQT